MAKANFSIFADITNAMLHGEVAVEFIPDAGDLAARIVKTEEAISNNGPVLIPRPLNGDTHIIIATGYNPTHLKFFDPADGSTLYFEKSSLKIGSDMLMITS